MFDILIENCAIVSMDDERHVWPVGALAIQGSRIAAVGPEVRGEARQRIDGKGRVAMPGLVNTHTHVYQSLIEGIGYDMHFDPWNWR
ncbi:MAG: amidohydrolase, partial [Chloroflexi bacterium]|nr:amidohydrolase [Chloroflexota bacterium]